ncbi:polysaccharide biosynthesis protein [uncultured Zobellia sp.]|uniref:polysaccharide biosynthesis protein n=1 Tax=uncultured Zobellia sp. TaxID=255433 RepID=UPI002594291C|nr:polysaccharide biosynthesis protein [uncultured Zobellia sp.]
MKVSYRPLKSKRVHSIWVIFMIDILLTAISFILSYKICVWLWPELSDEKMLVQLPIIVAIASLVFLGIGSSKGLVKYQGLKEVYVIFNAICLANILTIVLIVVHGSILVEGENDFLIPLSIIVVHSVLSFGALLIARLSYNFYYKLNSENLNQSKILLVATSNNSKNILKAFREYGPSNYEIVGIVNLGDEVPQRNLEGLPVINRSDLDVSLIKKMDVSELFIEKNKNFKETTNEFLIEVISLPIKVKVLKVSDSIEEAKPEVISILELNIEDVYERPLVNESPLEDDKLLLNYYKNKKVLILGAAGCVGQSLTKKILRLKCEHVMILDKSDDALFIFEQELKASKAPFTVLMADILDKARMERVFKDFSPDIVINAVGYKIFDFTKVNLYEAVKLNILANKLISDLAIRNDVSKYVNLTRNLPVKYCTYARATERIAEMYLNCLCSKGNTEFVNIRFGNVLESPSSVLNVFKSQAASGGPVKISNQDADISFIGVKELSNLIIEATMIGRNKEIYMVDKGKSVKEFDLAKQVIKLLQQKEPKDIDIVIAEDPNQGENRCEIRTKGALDIKKTDNSQLTYIIENSFNANQMKLAIDELCVTNLLLDNRIVGLMENVLNNKSVSMYKSNELSSVKLQKKGKPLTIVK